MKKNAFIMDNKMRSKIGKMFLTSNFVKQVFWNIEKSFLNNKYRMLNGSHSIII